MQTNFCLCSNFDIFFSFFSQAVDLFIHMFKLNSKLSKCCIFPDTQDFCRGVFNKTFPYTGKMSIRSVPNIQFCQAGSIASSYPYYFVAFCDIIFLHQIFSTFLHNIRIYYALLYKSTKDSWMLSYNLMIAVGSYHVSEFTSLGINTKDCVPSALVGIGFLHFYQRARSHKKNRIRLITLLSENTITMKNKSFSQLLHHKPKRSFSNCPCCYTYVHPFRSAAWTPKWKWMDKSMRRVPNALQV